LKRNYESPIIRRYGPVAEITASDFKCTPGGDGGFAIWAERPDDTGNAGGYWENLETGEMTDPYKSPGSLGYSCSDSGQFAP
jgi:hypothetical protein